MRADHSVSEYSYVKTKPESFASKLYSVMTKLLGGYAPVQHNMIRKPFGWVASVWRKRIVCLEKDRSVVWTNHLVEEAEEEGDEEEEEDDDDEEEEEEEEE